MAKPRIFISSTFYDLKHVRFDLENFIKGLGYDTIMNDRGNIPYSADRTLEDSCYDEVSRCDILLGIIGNKYGSSSNEEDYSISMKEIKTAIRNNKQVFIFVEKSVLNENQLYMANKEKADIKYVAVDNINIHKFIEEIRSLRINNAMIPFESSSDITTYLKEQFAGLFQRLLQERSTVTEQTTYYDLKEISNELKHTLAEIDISNKELADKIDGTLYGQKFVPHKIFLYIGLKKARVFVYNKESLDEILEKIGYEKSTENEDDNIYEYLKLTETTKNVLRVNKQVFLEDGSIKNLRLKEADDFVGFETIPLNMNDEGFIAFNDENTAP